MTAGVRQENQVLRDFRAQDAVGVDTLAPAASVIPGGLMNFPVCEKPGSLPR